MRGYTLVELLMVAAVLAGLLVIAIPAWQAVTNYQRSQSIVDQIRDLIYFARSEAAKRGVPVTIKGRGTWSAGQVVLVGKDQVLRVFEGVPSGTTLTWHGALGNEETITIMPSSVTEIQNGSFMYCPADRRYARKIKVSTTGMVSVENAENLCNTAPYENSGQ